MDNFETPILLTAQIKTISIANAPEIFSKYKPVDIFYLIQQFSIFVRERENYTDSKKWKTYWNVYKFPKIEISNKKKIDTLLNKLTPQQKESLRNGDDVTIENKISSLLLEYYNDLLQFLSKDAIFIFFIENMAIPYNGDNFYDFLYKVVQKNNKDWNDAVIPYTVFGEIS